MNEADPAGDVPAVTDDRAAAAPDAGAASATDAPAAAEAVAEAVAESPAADAAGLGLDALPRGAGRPGRRVGRGPGSGRGKTSGRGSKGQKSRSGTAINGFEGGQMPIHMRMPKRGFRNAPFRRRPVPVNLDRIQAAVDAGRIDAEAVVDMAALKRAGLVRRAPDGVRILGRGELTVALRIEAVGVSATAAAQIRQAGGSFVRIGDRAVPAAT